MRRTIGSTLAAGLFLILVAPLLVPPPAVRHPAISVETRTDRAAGAMAETRADVLTPPPFERRDEAARPPLSEAALGIGRHKKPAAADAGAPPEAAAKPTVATAAASAVRPAETVAAAPPLPPERPAPSPWATPFVPLVGVASAEAEEPAADPFLGMAVLKKPVALVRRVGSAVASGNRFVIDGSTGLIRDAAGVIWD